MKRKCKNIFLEMSQLTDFTKDRWKSVDIQSVKDCVQELNDKVKQFGLVFGELNLSPGCDVQLNKASHCINNIEFNEADLAIYGDVTFIKGVLGQSAEFSIENSNTFNIRALGITYGKLANSGTSDINEPLRIEFKKIFTWDIDPYI